MQSNKAHSLFPLRFQPGMLASMLGFSSFAIDGDHLIVRQNKKDIQLPFSEISQIKADKQYVHVLTNSEASYRLKTVQKAKDIEVLLNQLVSEFKEFAAFVSKSEELSAAEHFAFFKKCFCCRARPYVWAAEVLLIMALTQQLSDLHFEPLEDRVKVSLRCFGEVSSPGHLELDAYNRLTARIKYLAGCMSHLSDIAQEGAFHDKRTGLDVRVSTFPTDLGERLSLRLIQPLRYASLDSLGWKSEAATAWRQQISGNAGLFIISGAVGSGKTTALYASLAELAGINSSLRVVTLEDPVEGRIPGICQSSLDSMRNMTLAQAFKHLLRQDPDVIALGEIRDKECLQQALQAGLSGHCVLATFHAGRGHETLERIRQMGIEDYLVLSGLKGILHLELEHKNGIIKADAEIVRLQEGSK